MNVTLYQTSLRPSHNAVYESLDKYLATLKPTISYADFTFIKPALQTSIKIDLTGKQFGAKEVGNYLVASDGSGTWYYFVLGCQWKAKNTLMLNLGLDTLNTYWDDLKDNFSAQTHISRRYKDRFIKSADSLVAKVDAMAESISAPPQVRVKSKSFDPSGNFYNGWYLVYKTMYADTSSLASNPVTVLAVPSVSTSINTTNVGTITLDDRSFTEDSWILLGPNSTAKCGSTSYSTSDEYDVLVGRPSGAEYLVLMRIYKPDASASTPSGYVWGVKGDTVDLVSCNHYYKQTSSLPAIVTYYDGSARVLSLTEYYSKVLANTSLDTPITIRAGETYSSIPSFADWYETGCTDPTVVKILQLPYPPFTFIKDSTGALNLPSGWEFTINGLVLTDKSRSLSCDLGQVERYLPSGTDFVKDSVNVSNAFDLKYETKLYNSAFITSKLVYDTAVWVDRPENADSDYARDAQLSVTFTLSSSMDGTLLFTMSNKTNQASDFGESLVSTRTLEVPYFTNEYLNYLRYGKAVDERNRGLSVASTIASAAGTAASLAGAAAMGLGTGPGAVVSLAIGAVTAIIGTTSSIMKANDTINAKIDQYTHQSSQAKATSDVSIFSVYGKNRLLNIVYEPIPQLKEAIGNYFRLYGYADDSTGVPETETRYWSDYFVLEPQFKDDLVWNEFKEDIVARMKLGFRIHHWHDDYDFDNEKENWELSLVNW